MSLLNDKDMREFLRVSRTGFWEIQVKDGEKPRFFADTVMNELLGTEELMTPEERFVFHRAHVHEDDMEMFLEYSDKLSEERTEVVYRYIHPNQGEMYVRCGGKRVESAENGIRIIGFHQDISDTVRIEKDRQAEQRLAEQNQTLKKEHIQQQDYYKELLDVQNCGLMAYTLPGHKILHMNAEALRMYGYETIAEVQANLGKIISGFYYPNPNTVEKLKNLRDMNGAVDYEFVINHGTDKECHALAKTKRSLSPTGEHMVVTTFLDVSDMIMLQNALKRAEEGSRAKSAFLFNMSHDLRTPMNAIIGYADLMERHWGEQKATTEYLHKLQSASKFLLSLINNVLEMARIESGKEILNESACNINKVNAVLDTIMEAPIQEKHLTFTRSVNVTHEDIICDQLKINEIFLNIFSNAVKYTPDEGSIHVEVEELPAEREGYGIYRTSVTDSGVGIGKEYIPHLFEPFSREHTSSETGIIGTGLGLPIVKTLVEMMGGQIEVESEFGKGTTFSISIPHKFAEEEQTLTEDEIVGDLELEKLKGKKILLAEDNELNAEIAVTILNDAGMSVETVADGTLALQMLKEKPSGYYDLILMDIQMPKMNGYEATEKIRAWEDERSQIPIVAMTANAFEEDKRAAFAAGMNGHVGKPVEITKLMQILSEIIK